MNAPKHSKPAKAWWKLWAKRAEMGAVILGIITVPVVFGPKRSVVSDEANDSTVTDTTDMVAESTQQRASQAAERVRANKFKAIAAARKKYLAAVRQQAVVARAKIREATRIRLAKAAELTRIANVAQALRQQKATDEANALAAQKKATAEANAKSAQKTLVQPKTQLASDPRVRLIQLGHLLQSMGFTVGEHPDFGGVNPVHVADSWHYKTGAIDVNWLGADEIGHINDIIYLVKQYGFRYYWQVAGHYDHIHIDIG